jgi:hypothetical protein
MLVSDEGAALGDAGDVGGITSGSKARSVLNGQ